MRSLRGPMFKGLSALTLSLVAFLVFAFPVMAQTPSGAAQPGPSVMQFLVVMLAILVGIMVLTALLVAFLMWANGSQIPGISPMLQDLTAREVDETGQPRGLSNLGKIGLGLGGLLVVVLVAALAVPRVLSSGSAPQAAATPAPAAQAEATEPAAAPEQPAAPPASAPEAVVQAIQTGGCGACHVIPGVDGAVGVVGPSLAQVASHAEEVIASADYQGQATSAEEYIRESIVNPNAYVVPNFPSGVMPQNFEQTLSADQLDALVAYLATLQ